MASSCLRADDVNNALQFLKINTTYYLQSLHALLKLEDTFKQVNNIKSATKVYLETLKFHNGPEILERLEALKL